MRRFVLLAALLAAGPALAAPAGDLAALPAPQGPSSTLQPYMAVRSLQAVQDQVARGNAAAQSALPALLAHLADVFAAAGPAAWKDQRNAEAAALYLFSAGQPGAVRSAIEGADLSPASRTLIEGALAYAEGSDDRARTLLGPLEPRTLPRGLGGHLALVLASLYADTDPRKAGEMLDQARLLVPGTLVEEAALRRQIFLLAQPATADRFAALSRQYLRRFHASVFAGNFMARLKTFATDLAAAGDATALARLDPVIGDLTAVEARTLYLSLAREALVRGRTGTAHYAASRASGFTLDAGEAARAGLYLAASGAASENAEIARAALGAIDPTLLCPDDAALREAAIAVASSIDATAPTTAAGSGDTARPSGPTETAAANVIERARKAVAAADTMIGGAP